MKKLLGRMLVEGNEITEEQLEEALDIQKTQPKYLGSILIELGYIDEEILLVYLEKQGTVIKIKDSKSDIKVKKFYKRALMEFV